MQIVEMTLSVDNDGILKIPAETLVDIGIEAGQSVRVAYPTEKHQGANVTCEFLISRDGFRVATEGHVPELSEVTLPDTLIKAADISESSKVNIHALEGAIIITDIEAEDTLTLLDELYFVAGGEDI